MQFVEFCFWFFLFVVIYSYFGYALLLFIYLKIIKRYHDGGPEKPVLSFFEPFVTLIVAAFNEEELIEKKIQNTLEIDYPQEKLAIIFITDGSSDNTASVVSRYSSIVLLHNPERKGKVAAMNRAMKFVKSPVVVFSDANTLLNKESVKNIVRHYENPEVGGVAGEKKIVDFSHNSAASVGEGAYWKYESFIKKLDSSYYSVVGAAGELFSIRTELFEEINENVLLDDFVISLRICQKGYRIIYEPESFAMETPSFSIQDEQKRKIRISAGGFQAMYILKDLLNPFKNPRLSFQYISHRVLRWTVCPLFLPLIFMSNLYLVLAGGGMIFIIMLFSQLLFYALAFIGWVFANKNIKAKIFYLPYYFLFMNISLYLGFIRYLRNKQSVLWEKAARKSNTKTKVVS
jgi:biofilm PGA synthesis N-glycosyltransferase PgaC